MKLLIFLVFATGYSQINFQDNLIMKYEFQDRPKVVIPVDIDNDGDLDLVVGTENVILIFENLDGNGNFEERRIITNWDVKRCESMDVGDIDNDGDMDIVYTSELENRLVIIENFNNASYFQSTYLIDNPNSLQKDVENVLLVDIDSDGNLDLVYEDSNKIVWRPNPIGDGNFGLPLLIENNMNNLIKIKHGDLNNNSFDDIIISKENGNQISWFKNIDGAGNFSTELMISPFDDDFANSLHVVDLDNDGFQDVLSSENDGVYWTRNLGNETFAPKAAISPNGQVAGNINTADIDNDGHLDVVNISNSGLYWYKNDGSQNFTIQTIDQNIRSGLSIAPGDFDGNGTIDLASGSNYKTAWFKNLDGLGNFSKENTLYAFHHNPLEILHADMDNDSDLDLIVCSGGGIAWYENVNNTDKYNHRPVFYSSGINSNNFENIRSIFIADIDSDGDNDILAINNDWEHLPGGDLAHYDEVAWFENTNGLGTFSDRITLDASIEGGTDIFALDLDNDSDLDIITISVFDDTLLWYENLDGDANFGTKQIISTQITYGTSLHSEDLDNDNDMDILVSSYADGKIFLFKNLGNGNFSSTVLLNDSAGMPTSITTGDVDGDSDLDVIYTSEDLNQVLWQENLDGNANFGTPQIISSQTYGAIDVKAADIDQDNDIDIIVASADSGLIEWFENSDGLGNFNTAKIITDQASEITSIDIFDFVDGDYLEVFYTTLDYSRIAWCQYTENLDLNNFQQSPSITVYPNPTSGFININHNKVIKKLNIFNLLGKLVLKADANLAQSTLDISSLAKGVYILVITDIEGKTQNTKIIKQ